ncbi:MAG: hypothetical protein J4G04_00245, partial [Nitrosopumilaceae archaeon]|nr:hypothetical protein [Nitrosopumilaceae archaeon]
YTCLDRLLGVRFEAFGSITRLCGRNHVTMKSVDSKMDSSLENDAEILKVLGGMRGGGLLRITG